MLTQADLDGKGGGDGDLDNTATADTNETSPKSADFAVPLVYNPDFTIDKSVASITGGTLDGKVDSAGDIINYSIVVDNSGNVTLTGVTVTDQVESHGATNAILVSGNINSDGKLDVDVTSIYSASHIVTADDISGNGGGDGDIDNTATADTNETGPKSDSASVLIEVPGVCSLRRPDAGLLEERTELAESDARRRLHQRGRLSRKVRRPEL